MRVAVVTTSYPLSPTSSSGAFVARLVDHLPSSVSVTVLTPASNTKTPAGSTRCAVAVNTFRYAPQRWQILAHQPGGIPVALRTRKWTYLLLPGFLLSMLAHCIAAARRVNVLHANWAICGLIAGIAGKLFGVPVVTTLRGDDVTRAQRGILDRTILALCLHLSTRVVCVSNAIRKWTEERYPRCVKKLTVIENGVSDALLNLTPAPRASPFRFITVGSLIPRKNIALIISALQRISEHHDIVLTIVGDGPQRAMLEQSARLRPCRVEFLGAAAPEDIPDRLAASHAFVLASHSEGRPNAMLEAMAAGLPVIASDIPGVDELIEHGVNGLLFALGDEDALARHMQAIASDGELRQRLGRAARETIVARDLRWRTTGEKYAHLYRAVGGS